jgi:hypothetical protein
VWDAKILFVNDEWEVTPSTTKGWGEMIAGGVVGASQAIASRLGSYTDKHVSTTNPTHPEPPSERVASIASAASSRTAVWAETASGAALKVGAVIHEGGKKLGAQLPESLRPSGQPTPQAEKGELRKLAEGGWSQLAFAAKGIATAAGTVAGSVSQNAHKAVEHNFGKPAEAVAQGESANNRLVKAESDVQTLAKQVLTLARPLGPLVPLPASLSKAHMPVKESWIPAVRRSRTRSKRSKEHRRVVGICRGHGL